MKIADKTIKYCIGEKEIKNIFGEQKKGDFIIYYEKDGEKIGTNVKIKKDDYEHIIRSVIESLENLIVLINIKEEKYGNSKRRLLEK